MGKPEKRKSGVFCFIFNYLFNHYTTSFQSNNDSEMAGSFDHTLRWAMRGAID